MITLTWGLQTLVKLGVEINIKFSGIRLLMTTINIKFWVKLKNLIS